MGAIMWAGGGLPRLVDGAGAAAACSICLSWLWPALNSVPAASIKEPSQ